MKKVLVLGGLASIGYAFYYYFKKQISLALNFDYKLKDAKVIKLDTKGATLDFAIEVSNNSSFQVDIMGYDIAFKYKNVQLGNTKSNKRFTVNADSKFVVQSIGDVSFQNAKSVLLPFVKDVIDRKPIQVDVEGYIDVEFSSFSRRIEFNNKTFTYSKDLLVDVGLDDEFEKGKTKIGDILGKIGIKI